MPKRKDLKLDEYNISRELYRELLYFCQQYHEKKERLKGCYYIRSPNLSDTPRGGCTTDPTSRAVDLAMRLERDCEAIESAAREASPAWYKYLLMAVTNKNVTYITLQSRGLKINEKEFYKARRIFFYLLAKKMKKI